ncbi:MAG: metallophosphoesterase [Propionibacteriaceae bacterium]|jgi:predicted MPP superfamily phosphohydrolase|nr:metallophosphoesterase [Propionibacteriaceae bacterium]
MGLVIPVFLALVATAGAWLYFYFGLVRLPGLPKPAAIVTGLLAGLALALAITGLVASRVLPDPRPWRTLGRILLIDAAGLFYLGLGLGLIMVVNLVWWLISRLRSGRSATDRPAAEPAPAAGRRAVAAATNQHRASGRRGRVARAAESAGRRAVLAEPDEREAPAPDHRPAPLGASRRATEQPTPTDPDDTETNRRATEQSALTGPDDTETNRRATEQPAPDSPDDPGASRRAIEQSAPDDPDDTGTSPDPGAPRQRGLARPIDRRRQVTRWLTALATLTAIVTTALGVQAGAKVELNETRVALSCLPASFDGFRLALISDIHLGLSVSGQDLAQLVERVNQAEPDLVVLAGDLIDGTVEALSGEIAVLADLTAPYGTVMVTGNHEYHWNAPDWASQLSSLGIEVLNNSGIQLTGPGGSIDLIGVNDRDGLPPMAENLSEAIERMRAKYHLPLDAADRCRILVAHQPVQATSQDDLPARVGIDLQLSGHTHGGQMWPLGWLTRLQQPVLDGVHQVAGVTVVTSRGVGSWGPPVRVGAAPEVVMVTLRQG